MSKFTDFIWPTLEPWGKEELADIEREEADDISAVRQNAWARDHQLAIEEARRLSDSEDDRLKSTENKATTYILFAGAFIPVLTYLETLVWDPKLAIAPKWLSAAVLIASVLYLVRSAVWAFRAVQVGTYHRLGVADLVRIWDTADPPRAVIREQLVAARANREAINQKVSSFKMAHIFMKRALITFGILLILEAAWQLGSVFGHSSPNHANDTNFCAGSDAVRDVRCETVERPITEVILLPADRYVSWPFYGYACPCDYVLAPCSVGAHNTSISNISEFCPPDR